MLNALLCKGQGVAHNAPARPVYSHEYEAQICELEKAARERDLRRLERLERLDLEAQAEICAMAAGEPRRLSCQRDNNSRSCYQVKNTTYYNRASVALTVNVSRWALSIGKRYAPPAIAAAVDNVGYTPELIEAIEDIARNHIAEFTITIPHYADEDLQTARRRFTRVWNDFNRRYLKEKFSAYFGEYVRVFEAHKDGVLHAHVVIECKQSLRRGNMPFRCRTTVNSLIFRIRFEFILSVYAGIGLWYYKIMLHGNLSYNTSNAIPSRSCNSCDATKYDL